MLHIHVEIILQQAFVTVSPVAPASPAPVLANTFGGARACAAIPGDAPAALLPTPA
jgi:hypothetical protein